MLFAMPYLLFALGLALGCAAGWLAGAPRRRALAERLAAAEAAKLQALAAAEQRFSDQRTQYEARLQDLTVGQKATWDNVQRTLEALLPKVADDVLGKKTDQLRASAQGEFQLIEQQTVTKVSETQAPMQAAVEAMRQQLEAYMRRFAELETERATAAARAEEQIARLAQAGQAMAAEAGTLKQALRGGGPVRGSWGEQTLANILEQCGLREGTDYCRQVAVPNGFIDFVLEIPPGARLAIDCKAPDFVPLSEAQDEASRRELALGFADNLGKTAADLAKRNYRERLERSIPYVVMFVPSEAAFRAALDAQPGLFQEVARRGVVLASPTTIFPTIALLACTWSEHRAQKKAQELLEECKELGARLNKFLDHLGKVGRALDNAGKAYDAAVGSYQSRLAPQIRTIQALNNAFQVEAEPARLQGRPTLGLAAAHGDGGEAPLEAGTAAEDEPATTAP